MSDKLLEITQDGDVAVPLQDIELSSPTKDKNQMESPFKGIGWLIRLHCTVGILPGNLSEDCMRFTLQWWRYALAPGLTFLYIIVITVIGNLKYGQGGYFNEVAGKAKLSNLDRAVNGAHRWGMAACVIHTVCLTHKSLKFWAEILAKIARPQAPSAKAVVIRHLCLMAITFILSLSLHIGLAGYSSEAFKRTPDFYVVYLGAFCYSFILLNVIIVPDLMVNRTLQTLNYQGIQVIRKYFKDNQEILAKDKDHYFKELDDVFQAFNKTEKHMGRIVGNIVTINVVFLLYAIYTLIFLSLVSSGKHWSNWFFGFAMVLYIVLGIVRLLELTGNIQDFMNMAQQHKLVLVDLELSHNDKSTRALARKYISLLSPINGISVQGYFVVNRQMLIGISSYILTFVIILVEFKLNDLN